MRKITSLMGFGVFVIAAGVSIGLAIFAAKVVETRSRQDVMAAFAAENLDWADVATDGLQLFVIGVAPSEALRFKAQSVASGVVDATRVIDQMTVYDNQSIAPPEFRLEILRTENRISLFGVLPEQFGIDDLISEAANIAGPKSDVTQLLELAKYPAPEGWARDVRFALSILNDLKTAKISVTPNAIQGDGVVDTQAQKTTLMTAWANRKPEGVRLQFDIAVPRPVVAPYVFRASKSAEGLILDACTVQTAEMQTEVLNAISALGGRGDAFCQIGLGRPTSQWAAVAIAGMTALSKFETANLTVTDMSVRLEAGEGTPPDVFDLAVSELKSALPQEYNLVSVLPKPQTQADLQTEITLTRSPEGLVIVRGPVASSIGLDMISSLGKARFGQDGVHVSMRVRDDLADDKTQQILTGLETIAKLTKGSVVISDQSIKVAGETNDENAKSDITALFADRLTASQNMEMNVTYIAPPVVVESVGPTPQECLADIAKRLEQDKINFEPGSDRVDLAGQVVLDDIAVILRECDEIELEIAGHTDSQGREEMNLNLSQSRADAVLMELQRRRILTSGFVAQGYGETRPIAPNDTEEGREQNRRIEFTLILPAEPDTPLPEQDPEQSVQQEAEQTNEQN